MAKKKTEKRGKLDTNSVGPGVWQETLKKVKHEKYALQDQDCGEKTEKRGKRETHIVVQEVWRETLKSM